MRRRGFRISELPLLCLLLLAVFLGCSGKPPEIQRVFAEPILIHDTQAGTYSEKLSVFMVASDPDGMEDLANLYVIQDSAELYWSLESKSWVTATAEGESWIGSNNLGLPGGAPLPGGEYRVILEDAGGNTVEKTFTLPEDIANPAKVTYPTASVKEDVIRVSSSYPGPEVWVFGRDGRFLLRFAADPAAIPLTLKGIATNYPNLAQGFTYWAYAYDAKDGYGLMNGPNTAVPGQQ